MMGIDQINGTMLTTFDVWSAQEQVNGDGILMYPPQNPTQGPLSSIRLENIRDGTDQSLSQCAGEPSFPVLATCIVFLDHVKHLQIHAMCAKFHIVFFTQNLRSECPAPGRAF